MNHAVVILAAGEGTRMKSNWPKILHPVAGAPMVRHVFVTAQATHPSRLVVVIRHGVEAVRQTLGTGVEFVVQAEPLGTGHAVLQARPVLAGQAKAVMVLYGDTPLITVDTLHRMLARHAEPRPVITMLTVHLADPTGYGRIVRDDAGRLQGIIEEAVATPEQRIIDEINPGFYVFDADWLWPHLERIPRSPAGEYYLTDLLELAVTEGRRIETLAVDDPHEVLGVNTRVQQAAAEAILRDRIRRRWLEAGVTLIDPTSTWIDADVRIGRDTIIYPDTFLEGRTIIGEGCLLGPGTLIRDGVVGDGCEIRFSVIEAAVLEDNVHVAPFSHLRAGMRLGSGVHIPESNI